MRCVDYDSPIITDEKKTSLKMLKFDYENNTGPTGGGLESPSPQMARGPALNIE